MTDEIKINEEQHKIIETIHVKERELMEVFEKIPYSIHVSNARISLHRCIKEAVEAATVIKN